MPAVIRRGRNSPHRGGDPTCSSSFVHGDSPFDLLGCTTLASGNDPVRKARVGRRIACTHHAKSAAMWT